MVAALRSAEPSARAVDGWMESAKYHLQHHLFHHLLLPATLFVLFVHASTVCELHFIGDSFVIALHILSAETGSRTSIAAASFAQRPTLC